MIKLGEMQTLEVAKEVSFGVYLREPGDTNKENEVLLPTKFVPEKTKKGDMIEVFVYRDSNDRIIATTQRPKLTLGEVGYLKVAEKSRIGAFLNWGLEKDLFLPFKEQIGELRLNGEYMVGIYIDKSNRLCATMNLFNVLRTDSPYKMNDRVTGTVFSMKRGLGAMVAVDNRYLGLIHEGELFRPVHIGDKLELRVSMVKPDGKLDLSFKDAPQMQIDTDGQRIYNKLKKNGGKLPFNDSSSPQAIIENFNMSKSSFKKAIGRLLKKNLIVITRNGIELPTDANRGEFVRNKKSGGFRKGTANRQSDNRGARGQRGNDRDGISFRNDRNNKNDRFKSINKLDRNKR